IDFSTFTTLHHNHNENHQGDANRNHGHDHDHDDDSIEIIDGKQEHQFKRRRRAVVGRKRLAKVERDAEFEFGPRKNKNALGVMKRAEAFCLNSKYPCFIQEMQLTYISQDVLRIPASFCRTHLFGLEGKAKIGVNGSMKWDIELRINGERATFNAGWRNFCRNYDLKLGDICVFEMIEVTPLSFNIEIFRAREEPITPSHQNLLQAYNQRLTQPKKVEGQNSQSGERKRSSDDGTSMGILNRTPNMQVNQFEIQMKDYHLSGATMYLPNGFLRSHKECLGKYVNLKAGEISRSVKLLSRGAFSEGWLGFTRDCNMKIGDICTFNLADDQNICFEVSITKSKE
ncbi:hypothetical protein PIB30_017273, partial [Stylosanthes scabra]|nr:hypothetical protein [Stylosanthes scabra]